MRAATDPPRRHWLTVDDYYRMAEVGILQDGVYTLVDDPELDLPVEIGALAGLAVDLRNLFG